MELNLCLLNVKLYKRAAKIINVKISIIKFKTSIESKQLANT